MLSLLILVACTSGDKDSGGDTAAIVGDATNGETLFGTCAGCHGADGTGGIPIDGVDSADLTVRVPAKSDAELEDTIMNGFGTAMGPQYTAAQDVADVIAYLRVTFP